MDDNSWGEDTDILQRQAFIDRVLTVIASCTEQRKSLSFSIDGGWGYGKTFILDRIQERLTDCTVLRYDSWKYDYYEEPLVALISSISDQLQDHALGIDTELIKSVAKAAASMAWHCAAEAAGHFSFILKAAEKTYKELQDGEKKDLSYDTYSSLKRNLSIMQTLLTKIGENKPVILMIDELDRCLPAYQVKVLERIHHVVTGIPGIVIVYALNPDQLSETIRQIYGSNEDRVTAYLKKFLDFSLTLDIGMVSTDIEQKHVSDIALFDCTPGAVDNIEESKEWFQKVCAQLLSKLEIRVQEKLWQKRRIIHNIVFPKEDKPLPLIYLTCELMLLAMNEWKKRAYIPNSWDLISWRNDAENIGAFLHSGFRKKMNNDNDVVLLPENVQSFWKDLCNKMVSSRNRFSSNEHRLLRTYYIDAPIPKAAVLSAAAWTYVDDSPYLQFTRSGDYEADATNDILIHLKQSMKQFNEFVKSMS